MGDMDSINSVSSQSSSGGEEEYETSSRGGVGAESFPSLFYHQQNHQAFPPSAGANLIGGFSSNNQPLTSTSYFDPLATYFDHLARSPGSSNPNPVLNPDPVWSKDIMSSEPLQPQLVRGSAPSSSTPEQSTGGGGAAAGGRNPKKRTRASRRAPTTVLTTDTSNFRAMVQEFTGIPAPPFGSSVASSSLLFPRTRLDLFGHRGGSSNPSLLDPSPAFPPYLLRPFPQKIPVSLPFTSAPTSTTTTAANTTTTAAGNYQFSDLGLLTTMPNNLYFPSLLDPPRKYPSTNPGPNPDPGSSKPSSGGSLELPLTNLMDEFAHDHDQDHLHGLAATLLTTASSDAAPSGKATPLGWAEGLGLGADAGASGSRSGDGGNAAHSHQLRLGNGAPVGDYSKEGGPTAVQSWLA